MNTRISAHPLALSLKHASSYLTSFLFITDKGGALCFKIMFNLKRSIFFTTMWLSRSLHHWGA